MTHHTPPPPDTSVKVPHLVFGLLFLGLAGLWASVAGGLVDADSVPALGPALLIVVGVIGLAASLAGARNRSRRVREYYEQQEQADEGLSLFEDDRTEEIR